MPRFPAASNWSTLTLLGVGVCFGALGFFAGRCSGPELRASSLAEKSSSLPAPAASPAILSPEIDRCQPASPVSTWADFVRSSRTPAIEQKMLGWLEDLAARDHLGALALAAAEPNWRFRSLLVNAALKGWASTAPTEAAEFALHLPEQDRRAAFSAIFQGAVNQPERAAQLAAYVIGKDPLLAEDHGQAFIETMSSVGAFGQLARFASSDATGHRAEWLNSVFCKWAEINPAAARDALDTLIGADARAAAFRGLALGWSAAEPREMAAYATSLPEGDERTLLLKQALAQWVTRDPAAVAEWTLRFDPGLEFDLSAATVATQTRFATEHPRAALGWAQSIVEPALRNSTLTTLGHQWAREQPENARRIIAQMPDMLPADREVLLASLNDFDSKR